MSAVQDSQVASPAEAMRRGVAFATGRPAHAGDDSFEEIRVWRQPDRHRLWLYRCLRHVSSGHFAVQSRDRIYLSGDAPAPLFPAGEFFGVQGVSATSEHCSWHDTLDAAIEAHDARTV